MALFLAWRNVAVRYKQTLLGVAWALIQPIAFVVIFTIAFGVVARVPTGDVPYPLFAYSALVPWQFFASALADASSSVIANERLITKVYFPRLLISLAAVMTALVDLLINSVVLVVVVVVLRHAPGPIWYAPFFASIAVLTAIGIGSWLAALNVRYRDVRYVVPFLTQFWLFATPVAYPLSAFPEPWGSILRLNPMATAVEGFRAAVLGTPLPAALDILVGCAVTAVLLVSGVMYFRSVEREFADVI